MKYRCWYLGHAWGMWEGDLQQFSRFHHDGVDHYVRRWRYCERCGKKKEETYFVPGISGSRVGYRDLVRLMRDTVEDIERHMKGDEAVRTLHHTLSRIQFKLMDIDRADGHR